MAMLAMGAGIAGAPGIASADATDDYPIPHRMIVTTCTAEQIMSAARDVEPVYYERYLIDYHNHSPEIQQATRDQMHWFYSLDAAARRAYSEQLVTHFADPLTVAWPNYAKLFFNNKGVAAHTTDICGEYPSNDQAAWNW
ncbi:MULTISPECIES: DUF5078 domain-containing protein [Mycobacterium]|nr:MULTISPECIES: DUF5078 domain-containing protein [Mycobacterium]